MIKVHNSIEAKSIAIDGSTKVDLGNGKVERSTGETN